LRGREVLKKLIADTPPEKLKYKTDRLHDSGVRGWSAEKF